MPRQQAVSVENKFIRGLITEATGLNFPEDACVETFDCVFDQKGNVTRRKGIDYEGGYETDSLTRSNEAIATYYWRGVGGSGTLNYIVVQIGDTLYFYEEDDDGPLSPGFETFSVGLDAFSPAGAVAPDGVSCQFAAGKGYLFVTHPYLNPFYLVFDSATPEMDATSITIQIRDFEGLPSTATYPDNTTRPTSTRAALDDFDEYNLLNQGWGQTAKVNGGTSAVLLDFWDTTETTMPALCDVWYMMKDTTNEFDPAGQKDINGRPNHRAPQGHYILNAFLQERDVVSGVAGLSNDDVTSSYFRPRCVAFYAGRVFYGGVDYPTYNTKIYFSQIVEQDNQIGRCYQQNDPVNEDTPDLLPSDGGVIVIPEIATVIKMVPMGSSLYVFATNGVWVVSGSSMDGLGFQASDYSIRKISSVTTLSGNSFVDVEGTPIWWNLEGIFTIAPDERGDLAVTSLTRTTINDFFLSIPVLQIQYVVGAYNRQDRVVQWLYGDTTTSDVDDAHNFTNVLNFNVNTGAFYPWTIDTSLGYTVNGIVCTRGNTSLFQEVAVTNAALTDVIDSTGQAVIVSEPIAANSGNSFRYLTSKNTAGTSFDFTWAQEIDTTYKDWETPATGVSYESYFITGYKLHGKGIQYFGPEYLLVNFKDNPDSSCFFQAIWDFSSNETSGKFSTPEQVYRNISNRDYQQARIKVRGKGRSLQFKFYSEEAKPFNLSGWIAWETSHASV